MCSVPAIYLPTLLDTQTFTTQPPAIQLTPHRAWPHSLKLGQRGVLRQRLAQRPRPTITNAVALKAATACQSRTCRENKKQAGNALIFFDFLSLIGPMCPTPWREASGEKKTPPPVSVTKRSGLVVGRRPTRSKKQTNIDLSHLLELRERRIVAAHALHLLLPPHQDGVAVNYPMGWTERVISRDSLNGLPRACQCAPHVPGTCMALASQRFSRAQGVEWILMSR